MNHLALYRKWRPTRFDQVCGQDPITSVLSYQVMTGKTSHAYLFTGSRGTGKTTCAKILARAVNCLDPQNGEPCGRCEACRAIESETATDVVEMDAASNNGVEYIRDIREEVVYTPAMLKNRVYIIDEVHMLSVSAFNALLKTLEEPPERVIFILATTELHKIPATILSRCQRFDFRRLRAEDITGRLETIATAEGMEADREALFRIARLAQGGMRDAISMLELCAAGGKRITAALVQETAGVSGFELLAETMTAVAHRDYERVFAVVDALSRSSRDVGVFLTDLIGFARDMLILHTVKTPEAYLELTEGELDRLRACAQCFTTAQILHVSRILDDCYVALSRASADKRLLLETALLRLCDATLDRSTDALLARISALEAAVASGAGAEVAPCAAEVPASDSTAQTSDASGAGAEVAPCAAEVPVAEAPAVPKEAKASTPARADSPSSASSASSARPIPDFIEAVRGMEKLDMSAASILKSAKAFFDGTTVQIAVENEFFRRMLERDTVKDALLAQIRLLPGLKATPPAALTVTVSKKASAKDEGKVDLSEFQS